MTLGVASFLEDVKSISRVVCSDRLVSIRQFGSVVDGQYKTGISDIDFIVLVTDDCSQETIDRLRSELVQLEAEHMSPVSAKSVLFNAFLHLERLFSGRTLCSQVHSREPAVFPVD